MYADSLTQEGEDSTGALGEMWLESWYNQVLSQTIVKYVDYVDHMLSLIQWIIH